jgi:serine/threonine-protein kinase SRPK3
LGNSSNNTNNVQLGTRHYRPPEIILRLPYNKTFDMWSLGCIIYELITLEILFSPKSDNMSSNSNHLGIIIKILGKIPKNMIKESKIAYKYFDLKSKKKTYLYQYLIKRPTSICQLLYRHGLNKKEAEFWEKIINPLFELNPNKRITSSEYMNYLNYLL